MGTRHRENDALTRSAPTRLVLSALLALSIGACAHEPLAVRAAGSLQTLALVGGQPDDVAIDSHHQLIWGDLARGTIDRLSQGRVVVVASGLSVPEGIVSLAGGAMYVAEQGRDRILRVSPHGAQHVIYALQPVPGQEGVDGIGRDPHTGALLIPDSPRGTVVRLDPASGRGRTLAKGLGRPVDAAVDAHGNVLVPDEHLGTLVVISPRGRVSYRGSFATPDDVAVDRSGRVWVTSLGDGGLWLLAPGATPRRVLAGLGNPQGLVLDTCGDPIVVDQNAARIVRLLLTATSQHCSL